MSRRVWFSLGSNLGNRSEHLQLAVDELSALGNVRVSSVYQTAPVGGPEQPDYLNAVVEVTTAASPRELLQACGAIEIAALRERLERWGARTLDVDIIAIDGESCNEPDLQVPHLRAQDREFVMVPLAELVELASIGFVEVTRTDDVRLTDVLLSVGAAQ